MARAPQVSINSLVVAGELRSTFRAGTSTKFADATLLNKVL
jgi:hypothetical protein